MIVLIVIVSIYLIIGLVVLMIHEWAEGAACASLREPLDPLSNMTKFIIIVGWLPLLIKNLKDR